MDSKKGWLIAAVAAGAGCLVLVLFAGVFVFFVVQEGSRASAPVPMVPPPQPGPLAPAPVAPAVGYLRYTHSAPCPRNPRLVLSSFSIDYPAGYTVLPCTEQMPAPWAYVTFHREPAAGAEQITVSWGQGAVTPEYLGQAADDLARQLGASPTRELGRAPLMARGAPLVRRDSTTDVPVALGPFTPGTYVFRQVYVPGLLRGVAVLLVAPAGSDANAALAATEPTLRTVVESVRF